MCPTMCFPFRRLGTGEEDPSPHHPRVSLEPSVTASSSDQWAVASFLCAPLQTPTPTLPGHIPRQQSHKGLGPLPSPGLVSAWVLRALLF